MGEAAAKRAAGADRIMRDVPHHEGEQIAQRPGRDRPVERRVTDAGADCERVVLDRESVEPRDLVDVDEMRRACEAKRHGRHQALAARKHAAVLGRDLGENRDRLFEGFGRVIDERRGLHRPRLLAVCADATGFPPPRKRGEGVTRRGPPR